MKQKLLFSLTVIIFNFLSFSQTSIINQVTDCNTGCSDLTITYEQSSETSGYTVESITFNPPSSFDGLSNSLFNNTDDIWSSPVSLPFDFSFYGTTYNQFVVGSNGVISFDTTLANTGNEWQMTEPLPNNTNPTLAEANIFFAGHDVDPSVSATNEIAWQVYGNAPFRYVVVSFSEVPHFSGTCNSLTTTQMTVLYETTNVIEVYLLDKPLCNSWNGGNAVIGIQNPEGTEAVVPPGRNTGPWTAQNEAWQFNPSGTSVPNVYAWYNQSGTLISNDITINVCPTSDELYTAEVTYFNQNTGTNDTISEDIIVMVNPTGGDPSNLEICNEDDFAVFDLTTQETIIIGNSTCSTVTYYMSLSDAENAENAIAQPQSYTNITNPQTIYVRVENTASGSYETKDFDLIINYNPLAFHSELQSCDLGQGFGEFDLTLMDSTVTNGNSDHTVTYHASVTDAENGVNALTSPYINSTPNTQVIFARVNVVNNECYGITDCFLEVINGPTLETVTLLQCDDNSNDGIAEFNLAGTISEIVNGQSAIEITFFETQDEAKADMNPINIGANYSNISNPQAVIVKGVDASTGCVSYGVVELFVEEIPNPITPTPLIVCDDESNSGFGVFNLTDRDNEILSSLGQQNTDYSISYHISQVDADTGVNVLDPVGFINTTAFSQTVFVRVENLFAGCFGTTSLELIVDPDCTANCGGTVTYCYVDNDSTTWLFESPNGAPLNILFFEGTLETCCDIITIYDGSDNTASVLYEGNNGGDMSGVSVNTTSNAIFIEIDSDVSVNCEENNYIPLSFEVTCVDETAVPNCNAELILPTQGTINVNDDLNWFPASGIVNGYTLVMGTTPGGTDIVNGLDVGNVTTYNPGTLDYETTYYVTIIPYNDNGPAVDCVEESFTTMNNPNQIIDCSTNQIFNTVFCYENNDTTTFNFSSNDGSPLTVVFNSGTTENNWDELVVTDSDGTLLYNGYGNNGDLSGLVFVSSGDSISIGVTSDGSIIRCTNDPWNFDVFCQDTTVIPNCDSELIAPLNNAVDVNVNNNLSWSQATLFVTGYTLYMGTTSGGTEILDGVDVGNVTTYDPGVLDYETTYYITIVPYNDNGVAIDCIEESFITGSDPNRIIDCTTGETLTTSFCYTNNDTTEFSFASNDDSPVVVVFNSGRTENNFDELVVTDSDGTIMYSGYGDAGDLSGLVFTSSGGSITIGVTSDGSVISCANNPWVFTASCRSELGLIDVNAFIDENSNSIFDATEPLFAEGEFTYEINNNGILNYVDSSTGRFIIPNYVNTNTYDISFTMYDAYNSCLTQTFALVEDVSVAGGETVHVDFPLTSIQNCDDIGVFLLSNIPPRPGSVAINSLIIENFGSIPVSGSVEFTHDSVLTIDDILYLDSGNTITDTASGFILNFNNLQPGQQEYVSIRLDVPTSLNIGDFVSSMAVYGIDDIDTDNNVSVLTEAVVNSYDPNNKLESHGPKIKLDEFTDEDYLYYTINFQNVGTASAINIRIEDVLDSQLDLSTFKMLNSSHDYVLTRVGYNLTWKFDGINLPSQLLDEPNSNGYVYFKIKPLAGYSEGDIIPNTAEIYFDFNPPIITNTFETEFVASLSVNEFGLSQFSMYPNPAQDLVNIQFKNNISGEIQVRLFNVQGKQVLMSKHQMTSNIIRLNISDLTQGMYFVELKHSEFKVREKLIIK